MEQKKIKVVFCVNDFLVGGMQRQFVEQAKFFDLKRFDLVLITLFEFPGAHTLYDDLPKDLNVRRLNFRSTNDIRSWLELGRLLQRLRPDIVVSSFFLSNTIVRILKPFIGYVSIAREHNTHVDRPFWQRFINWLLAPLSYRIVAVSTTVADFTARHEGIPRHKFLVIHNGIDVQKVAMELTMLAPKETLLKELGFQKEDRLFLSVSRLEPQKNHQLLIDGFALFRQDFPNYKLAIVGDGTLRQTLEQRVRVQGVEEAVIFFGLRHDVWKFYKVSNAFVATSSIEGLSNAMLEALAAGLPLVATRTAGTDELIEEGKNGFFIETATPEMVAEGMRNVASLDASESRNNALAAAERFDIRTSVRKYEELFINAMKHMGLKALLKPIWNFSYILWVRGVCFNAFEILSDYWLERQKFKRKVGYELDLENPRSLNQKMVWKKIYDRNPLLPLTSDKYLVRQFVRDTLGKEEAEKILVPLLYVTDKPNTIPFNMLPEEYVIKTNHDSGGHIIVRKGEHPDPQAIISALKKWMATPYGVFKHEWCYGPIRRKVIVERLLRGEDGNLAQDYKFHVFNGVCRFIHTTPKVNGERSGKRSLFSPEWKLLPVGWKHSQGPDIPPPPQLAEMLRIAEKLATPFDYVRVDLYSAAGRVYFGELTHYHGGGMEKFDPESFDFKAGEWWNLVPKYWLKKEHGT